MTRLKNILGATTNVDLEYTFATNGTNNGRIQSMKDWVSGEQVTYTYDALNRLATATSNDPPAPGTAFTMDGFGNLTGQSVTKGSAPSMSITVDAATNRINGGYYDANGNQKPAASGEYFDVENRFAGLLTCNGSGCYGAIGYDSANRRVYEIRPNQEEWISFFSIEGKRLAVYRLRDITGTGGILRADKVQENFYFAGRLLRQNDEMIVSDRLGSVVFRKNLTNSAIQRFSYFPYGQEKEQVTAQDREKFATYWRDSLTG